MTHDDIRAFGKVYGILNSVLPLSAGEIEVCCFEPAEHLAKAVQRRERKLTPEHHERIAAIMAEVSPDVGGRISEADTGIYWIAYHQIQAPGRPSRYGEAMVNKTIKMPAELWDKTSEKAGQEGNSVSEVIRRLLTGYVS